MDNVCLDPLCFIRTTLCDRYRVFEKAFRLAIDLNEYDLFMDLHHYARKLGDTDMAEAALEKAYQVSECDSQSGMIPSRSYFKKIRNEVGRVCL